MTKQLQNEFLQKLYNLLDEYDATISWRCDPCSDLYGVTGEHMVIDIGRDEICLNHGGSYIDKSELGYVIKNNK